MRPNKKENVAWIVAFPFQKWIFAESMFMNLARIFILLSCCVFWCSSSDVEQGGLCHAPNSFINPNIGGVGQSAGIILGFKELSASYSAMNRTMRAENLLEWQGRFCTLADTADIGFVVYDASVNELQDVLEAARAKQTPLGLRLGGNVFATILAENGCTESISYLIYAKKCEPFCLLAGSWGAVERDTLAMRLLIREGLALFEQTSSHYIRLRIIYQLARMAHYLRDYPLVLQICDKLGRRIGEVKSVIAYWVMGHRAGALQSLGRRAEAAYWNAVVFANDAGKRQSAYQSFSIQNDDEWGGAFKRCRSDGERIALHTLRASAPNSRVLGSMKAIYALQPTSDFLDPLLVQELQRLEKVFAPGNQFNPFLPQKDMKSFPVLADYLIDFQEFVQGCIVNKDIKTPKLWRLADVYLTMLRADWYAAHAALHSLQDDFGADDELLRQQGELFGKMISLYYRHDQVEPAALYDSLYNDPVFMSANPNVEQLIRERTADIYFKEGHRGVAFLLRYGIEALAVNPQIDLLDDLIAFSARDTMSQKERYMLEDQVGKESFGQFLDIKATYYLAQQKYEAANELFEKIPRSNRSSKGYAIYRDELKDCVYCEVSKAFLYTKSDIAKDIVATKIAALAALNNSAEEYYRLGTMIYNLSYYGAAFGAADFSRDDNSWRFFPKTGRVTPTSSKTPFGNLENPDVALAKAYFELAIKYAQNPELGAKATFMAARCDQKQYLSSPNCTYKGGKNIPNLPETYRVYYRWLATEYANTAFYKKVVEECSYFRMYARK